MAYVSGFDRTQTALFPVTVDEMIDETKKARMVVTAVALTSQSK